MLYFLFVELIEVSSAFASYRLPDPLVSVMRPLILKDLFLAWSLDILPHTIGCERFTHAKNC